VPCFLWITIIDRNKKEVANQLKTMVTLIRGVSKDTVKPKAI